MPAPRLKYFHPRHGIAVVKQGYCWPAFLFGATWALARRAYRPFGLMTLLDVGFWFVTGYAEAQGSLVLSLSGLLGILAYAWVRGRYGNRWLAADLVRRGYALRGAAG